MRNIRLDIEYDGARYSGWQRQENSPSIQAAIEDILAQILQERIVIIGAGRTDSGVHARGQVANFRTGSAMAVTRIIAALNGLLPDDIVIQNISEVPADFHARYSAIARRYSYRISTAPTAIERHVGWFLRYNFNASLMQEAAALIVGEHDFQAFCRSGAEVNNFQCSVSLSYWTKDSRSIRYEIQANRFLHGMVRALVGTMVDIGRGFRPLSGLSNIMASGCREEAGPAAPARGLVLEEVIYPS